MKDEGRWMRDEVRELKDEGSGEKYIGKIF